MNKKPMLLLLVLTLAACGGDKESSAGSGGEAITCSGDPLTGSAGLPAAFPEEGVTFVNAEEKGQTHVVQGYSEDSLEGLYNDLTKRLNEADYQILAVELKEHRAKISYTSKDRATEGQIALRARCDNGNVSVRVTSRPA